MNRKTPTGWNRTGAWKVFSQDQCTVPAHKLQAPTVLFERLRVAYEAMAQRHDHADAEYDRRRIVFLKVRLAWRRLTGWQL